jgi:pyruvate kinase
VLDHADAVMLSGETAVGEFPVATVRMMDDIVRYVQSYHDETAATVRVSYASGTTEAALAAAVRQVVLAEPVAAVAVFTATGTTARMLAKSRLPCPVLGISQDQATVRRMCLYYGVISRRADAPEHTRDVLTLVEDFARQLHLADSGDRVIVVSGRPIGTAGATNTLVVHTIP